MDWIVAYDGYVGAQTPAYTRVWRIQCENTMCARPSSQQEHAAAALAHTLCRPEMPPHRWIHATGEDRLTNLEVVHTHHGGFLGLQEGRGLAANVDQRSTLFVLHHLSHHNVAHLHITAACSHQYNTAQTTPAPRLHNRRRATPTCVSGPTAVAQTRPPRALQHYPGHAGRQGESRVLRKHPSSQPMPARTSA